MHLGRFLRTIRSLHALQIAARPPHVLLSHLLKDLPSNAPPPLIERFSEPSPLFRRFAVSERERFKARIERLAEGSSLRGYEQQYGLELGSEPAGPLPEWRGPYAIHAYPASVRARRIAVAIRCGRTDLARELARAARAVTAQLEFHLLGNHLLENAIGLVCAASVTRGWEPDVWWKIGSALMDWQLKEQFLADGGHFELSASYHLALTAGVLEALELAAAGGRPVSATWRAIAEKAMEWALLVRAPDGTYPLFNDASLDAAPSIDSVVELGRACGFVGELPPKPVTALWFRHLRSTGWLTAGSEDGVWLCIDAGADGAPYQPGHVHADALTFELWSRGERTIVDYGVSSYAPDAARAETRATRSHNTVELDGRDSCEVWHAFRVGRRARSHMSTLQRYDDAVVVDVDHDGYTWLPGRPVHRRRMLLKAGLLSVRDFVVGGTQGGTSRLRLASTAASWVAVSGSATPKTRTGYWYPQYSDPREALILEQPVSASHDSGWTITWGS
jgi:hypothetical protein